MSTKLKCREGETPVEPHSIRRGAHANPVTIRRSLTLPKNKSHEIPVQPQSPRWTDAQLFGPGSRGRSPSPARGSSPRQYVQRALIRPIGGILNQSFTHRIFAKVMPFLLIILRATQARIPRFAFLPAILRRVAHQGRVRLWSNPNLRAGQPRNRLVRVRGDSHPPVMGVEFELSFPIRDPLVQCEFQVARGAEKMKVIRHEQVIADQPRPRFQPTLAEQLMHDWLDEPTFAITRHDRDEHDVGFTKADMHTRRRMFAPDLTIVRISSRHAPDRAGRVGSVSNPFLNLCIHRTGTHDLLIWIRGDTHPLVVNVGRMSVPSNPTRIKMPNEPGFGGAAPSRSMN